MDLDYAPAMHRFVLLVIAIVGCAPQAEDDVRPTPIPDFDAAVPCGIGGFEIAAPRADLHYAPSMDVYLDESELLGQLSLAMTDDLSNPYQWTNESSSPYPGDAGPWWSRDKFHYELAPSHRYTLTVSHCELNQSVTFFTSAQ
jgi:hypothetical protein